MNLQVTSHVICPIRLFAATVQTVIVGTTTSSIQMQHLYNLQRKQVAATCQIDHVDMPNLGFKRQRTTFDFPKVADLTMPLL